MVWLLGWRGVDQAAQFYRVMEFKAHGLMLLDAGWYGGNFPLGYSVLVPAIGAAGGHPGGVRRGRRPGHVGVRPDGVASISGSRPLGTWYFAISTVLPVAIGQLPFLWGEALGLAALVALQRGRRPLALLLGILAALCSPAGGRLPGHGLPGLGRLRHRPAGLAHGHGRRQSGRDPGARAALPRATGRSRSRGRAWS